MDKSRVQKSRILGQIGNRLAESGGFNPWHLLNDQIGVLMEEKKGYAAALEHPRSECFGRRQETFRSS